MTEKKRKRDEALKPIRDLIAELAPGADLLSRCGGISIEAPPSKIWNCADVHELVYVTDLNKVVDDARRDMRAGLRDCDVADCEWCTA